MAPRTVGHVFTIALGLLGWIVVVALPAVVGAPTPSVAVLPIALFVAVILAARTLAFRPRAVTVDADDHTVLSLDSAYYVAAALCVGSAAAGRLVAVALTLDATARLLAARRRGGPDGWWSELGYILYFGGMS